MKFDSHLERFILTTLIGDMKVALEQLMKTAMKVDDKEWAAAIFSAETNAPLDLADKMVHAAARWLEEHDTSRL